MLTTERVRIFSRKLFSKYFCVSTSEKFTWYFVCSFNFHSNVRPANVVFIPLSYHRLFINDFLVFRDEIRIVFEGPPEGTDFAISEDVSKSRTHRGGPIMNSGGILRLYTALNCQRAAEFPRDPDSPRIFVH